MLGGDAVLILAADLAGSQGQAGQKGMIVATGSHHAVENGHHSRFSDCHVQAPATASGGVKTVLSAMQAFAPPFRMADLTKPSKQRAPRWRELLQAGAHFFTNYFDPEIKLPDRRAIAFRYHSLVRVFSRRCLTCKPACRLPLMFRITDEFT